MASVDVGGTYAPRDKPAATSADVASDAQASGAPGNGAAAKAGFWQRVKGAIVRTENEFALIKGLAIVSVFGTLIGAYFQYLSSYQDKVSALAQADMTAAITAFTDTSNTLSQAITFQDLLFYDFIHAKKLNAGGDDNALTSKHARDLDKPYEDTASSLHENVNLIARKMEIYVDWPSNLGRDPATETSFGTDPINMSAARRCRLRLRSGYAEVRPERSCRPESQERKVAECRIGTAPSITSIRSPIASKRPTKPGWK
ncbi:MAG: hypothetical protein WBE14_26465 [Xanthobacteraceae bacterium]